LVVATIPNYAGFALPTAADVRAAVFRVAPSAPATAAWTAACAAADILSDAATLDTDQLERIAASLTASLGTFAVVGTSLRIRVRTFARLATRRAGSAA
jgi:hypothetical protein